MRSSHTSAITGVGPADPSPAPEAVPGATSGQIAQAVEFLFQATQLGDQGQQALKQWTTWAAYVAILADDDPHLAQLPGWNVVLPIDHAATANNLRRLLLRAGKSPEVALDAAQAFCTYPPFARENRAVPPIALGDTRHVSRSGKTWSDHGYTCFFDDDEILSVEPLAWRGQVDDIAIGRTHDGRHVVQQQSTRGCTAASTAMLILDQGFEFNPDELRYRSLAIDERPHADIRRAGLESLQTQVESLQTLVAQLKAAGPGEIGIFDLDMGSHSIILDDIVLDGDVEDGIAKVRDPYHGWAITIRLNALTERFHFPDRIIQALRPRTEQP